MKKTALILALAMVGVSAMAGLYISFNSAWGFNNPVMEQGEAETLWALVYSSSAIGTFAVTENGITDGSSTLTYKGDGALTASGKSTVLGTVVAPGTKTFAVKDVISGASLTTTGASDNAEEYPYMGGIQNLFDGHSLDASFNTGYIYQAVFQKTGDEVSYFVSDAIAAVDCGDPPATTSMYLEDAGARASTETIVFSPDTYTVSGVPEPATLSLLGLGALALAIRRRK